MPKGTLLKLCTQTILDVISQYFQIIFQVWPSDEDVIA